MSSISGLQVVQGTQHLGILSPASRHYSGVCRCATNYCNRKSTHIQIRTIVFLSLSTGNGEGQFIDMFLLSLLHFHSLHPETPSLRVMSPKLDTLVSKSLSSWILCFNDP